MGRECVCGTRGKGGGGGKVGCSLFVFVCRKICLGYGSRVMEYQYIFAGFVSCV